MHPGRTASARAGLARAAVVPVVLVSTLGGCASPSATSGRCTADGDTLTCAHQTTVLSEGAADREVHWQLPEGDPPESGWPVAFGFQGSLASAELNWSAKAGDPLGALYQVEVTDRLLAAGFAVITPEAAGDGLLAWDTNVPPYAGDWPGCPDDVLLQALFAGVAEGDFGPLDTTDEVAYGISSGGYMTSRMALSYPGTMRRLVIVSASWATCVGIACALPEALPADHPPTLFLHGGSDEIVPAFTMQAYADRLAADGVEVDTLVLPFVGHEWFAEAPDRLVGWMGE